MNTTHPQIENKRLTSYGRNNKMNFLLVTSDTCPHCISLDKKELFSNQEVNWFQSEINRQTRDKLLPKLQALASSFTGVPALFIFDEKGQFVELASFSPRNDAIHQYVTSRRKLSTITSSSSSNSSWLTEIALVLGGLTVGILLIARSR